MSGSIIESVLQVKQVQNVDGLHLPLFCVIRNRANKERRYMVPEHLYKFQKLNEQTLRNLKNDILYFSVPASFNDPFDCSALNLNAMFTDNTVIEIFRRYLHDKNIQADFQINSIKDVPQKDVDQIYQASEKLFKERQDELLNKRGCTCFSANNTNILLWSHYADGHRGICLKFDTSFEPFTKVKKVDYRLDFPSVNLVKMMFGNSDEVIEEASKPILSKYKCWDYEEEWRIFHLEPNKEYVYPVEALNSVYFGLNVNPADLEIVCLVLQGQSKNIKFYRALKDKSKYSLSFEEFTYTPYIAIPK